MAAKAGTETEAEWLNSGVPGCGFLCCVSLLPLQRVVSNIVSSGITVVVVWSCLILQY